MAKQTFTTGQVLTAAQMTSLQQTAMLGGSASAKVASYTLVAADAGTTVSMSNASATTITVNTGLFAAGDTVTILNVGAGTCTITAGTATVSKPTNATLALVTNAGGVLYFTATGAATFLPFDVGTGSTSPLTTKGDLFGYDTANARVPIGTNNQVLTADSTQALGLKWATPATGSETLISSTSLSGITTTISSIPSTYTHLRLQLLNLNISSTQYVSLQFNTNTTAVYSASWVGTGTAGATNSATEIRLNGGTFLFGGDTKNTLTTDIYFYNNSIVNTRTSGFIYTNSSVYSSVVSAGGGNVGAAITSVSVVGGNSFNGGTANLYGVK